MNADGSFKAPIFTVQGGSQSTVSDALQALDTTVTGNTQDIGDLQFSLNSGTTGLVRQDAASGAITVATASLAGTEGTRTLSGVKDAHLVAGSSEVVTGSQLFPIYRTDLYGSGAEQTQRGRSSQCSGRGCNQQQYCN